jgi:hypothetical protein
MSKKESRFQSPADSVTQDFQPDLVKGVNPDVNELQSRIAELEKQLAEKNAVAINPSFDPANQDDSSLLAWEVSLQYQPTRIVLATDSANAWQVYCKQMGVIASEYQPVIVQTSMDRYEQEQDYLSRLEGRI